MELLEWAWVVLQFLIGYQLVLPFFLFIVWMLFMRKKHLKEHAGNLAESEFDYAVIVTAFEQADAIPAVVNSILAARYKNFLVYVVADKCDISGLHFTDSRVVILRPATTLASNTASHLYAFNSFQRSHGYVTIIDSDNLVHQDYFVELNKMFRKGFQAVQGLRAAKNLNTTYACLDAARDLYYHFYDGIVLFQLGSSATLSGSGMAFTSALYGEFLAQHKVSGAGFDKVLQNFIVTKGRRIAFSKPAIVYDEKTSMSAQLVNQRSRWINTWFKYFKYGFGLFFKGLLTFNANKFLFGITLLRPPLFIFLILSVLCLLLNLVINPLYALVWCAALVIFVFGFIIALIYQHADNRIYQSLYSIPKFVFLQLKSLVKSRNANKRSVATKHYIVEDSDIINTNNHEDRSKS